jgi:hypothetical protein
MNNEHTNSPRTSLNEIWRIAVKRIAPNHAVDADELLRKVPNLFPGDLVNQQDIDGFMSEFLVRTEGMTLAEKKVCLTASNLVAETIWQNILHCVRDMQCGGEITEKTLVDLA